MRSPRKNSFSFLFFIIPLTLLIILFLYFYPQSSIFKSTSAPPSSVSSSEISSQQLTGIIQDATMNTLAIQTPDGTIYSFDTDGVSISAGSTGLEIGNPVTLLYQGKLDESAATQSVTIQSITVQDAASTVVATASPTSVPSTDPVQMAKSILNGMSLEEKVGQMFLVRCPEQDAAQLVSQYHLGGYLLFGQDFAQKSKEQVVKTIQSYQDAAQIPLFIGVDEEGGSVNRVSSNPNLRTSPFQSPQQLYQSGGFDAIKKDTLEKSTFLKSLGINLNFAPVCDVSQNPDDYIYDRSFGQDAEQTAQYVSTVVSAMKQQQMGSVLKHFPGYGNNKDTHTGIAYDNRSYDTFVNSDFLPFEAGIQQGADIVLVSHNIVSSIDDSVPASLSPKVHEILRKDLGFSGVIITDDLYMDGIRDFAGVEKAAVLAVQAGNDLLCSTEFSQQIPAVIDAVHNGEIPESRIDESVLRILELKISLGIIS